MKYAQGFLTSANLVVLAAGLAILAICGSLLLPESGRELAAAQDQPESGLASRNIDFLLADMTDEAVAAELREELADLDPVLKAILPKDFSDPFVKQFVEELPQLRKDMTSAAEEIFTDEELEQLAEFHREHPELAGKQKRFTKDLMRRCKAIGERIGRMVGTGR